MTTLITGAAGNLGSMTARHLLSAGHSLRLMIHKKGLPDDLARSDDVSAVMADLGDPQTLAAACEGVSTIVHFAGVLFKPRPEKFLPVTNTAYFKNLVDAAVKAGVKKIILISFPHVEGETTPDNPATGKLDGSPVSVHAQTRLAEEQYLFETAEKSHVTAVSLRAGMVYGKGILMLEGARWFARHHMLGVWRKPTWIHLISSIDFNRTVEAAVVKKNIRGIYHVGDEGRQTLQEFLDRAVLHWGYGKPWRMPAIMIFTAAVIFEVFAFIFRTRAPLTRDFVRIGMMSYYGDTVRMRKELLPELEYPALDEGIILL